jgi:hypothetical protein
MQRRVLETRKKVVKDINVTWRRKVSEEGRREESFELCGKDFWRLIADSFALSRLKAERVGNV